MTSPHVQDHDLADKPCPACLLRDCRTAIAVSDRTAQMATPGPWKVWGMSVASDRSGTGEINYNEIVAETRDPDCGLRTFNADHIAANDPSTRLALNRVLAGVLDGIAMTLNDHRAGRPLSPTRKWCAASSHSGWPCESYRRALASLTDIAEWLGVQKKGS